MQGHNRYWASDTTYANQNGGKWKFDIDNSSGYALPREQGFWDFLLGSARRWGLQVKSVPALPHHTRLPAFYPSRSNVPIHHVLYIIHHVLYIHTSPKQIQRARNVHAVFAPNLSGGGVHLHLLS